LITNKINGKKYLGKHSTMDIYDSYMGSGKLIRFAIDKYGIQNFEKEILFMFDNKKDMETKEKELVNEAVIQGDEFYNLAPGGQGGDMLKFADEERKKLKSERISLKIKGKPKTPEHRKAISLFHADISGKNNPMYGKPHKESTKEKIREKSLNREKKACPYCKKLVDVSNFKRWHGENCKTR
jgi:group I intron endonuclease